MTGHLSRDTPKRDLQKRRLQRLPLTNGPHCDTLVIHIPKFIDHHQSHRQARSRSCSQFSAKSRQYAKLDRNRKAMGLADRADQHLDVYRYVDADSRCLDSLARRLFCQPSNPGMAHSAPAGSPVVGVWKKRTGCIADCAGNRVVDPPRPRIIDDLAGHHPDGFPWQTESGTSLDTQQTIAQVRQLAEAALRETSIQDLMRDRLLSLIPVEILRPGYRLHTGIFL